MQAVLEYKPDYQTAVDRRNQAIRAHVSLRVDNYPVDAVLDRIDGGYLFLAYIAATDAEAVAVIRRYLFHHRAEFPELVN